MKRLIIASVVILCLAALTFWGNRILSTALDAKLGPLLREQLGLPVQLGPIKAQVLTLQASSPQLIMGDPKAPAVVATGVEVALSWPDLLQGEVRLVSASAADLMLRPSRWPTSDSPLPDNYAFLDQWLPGSLQLETGRYVDDSGTDYPVSKLQWQRHASGGASARWVEAHDIGTISIQARLKSLPDLLQLDPIELELAVEVEDKPDSLVTLTTTVQPGKKSGYTLQTAVKAAGMAAQVTSTGQTDWQMPQESDITVPLLDKGQLQSLIDSYRSSSDSDDLAAQLAATVPRLQLPEHHGHVAIDEIHFADEISKENAFDFATGEQGLQISALTMNGPVGILTGELGIVSSESGWTVNADANVQARESTAGIAAQYVGTDWLWRTGRAQLNGKGDTWDTLLNSLQGDISLAGDYRSKVNTPVTIDAQLDNRPGEFALDKLAITLGKGRLDGSAALSGTDKRKLTMDLKGAHLDLGFLFDTDDDQALPGMALPEYLKVLPELDLNLTANVEDLQTPTLNLAQASATLERTPQGGKLVATGKGTHHGTLDLTLQATTPQDTPADFQLTANFTELDLPGMFRQQGLLYSRSSGTLNFQSQGKGMEEIFTALQGSAKLSVDIRSDNDWQRPATAEERLAFSGDSSLVIENDRIVGVEIKNLDIDSIEQDLTGNLSLVARRDPWLVANLHSNGLNVTHLLALLPKSAETADDSGLLPSLQRLGAMQVSLNAKSLIIRDLPLADVQLELVSGPDIIDLKQFDFVSENGTLKSRAKVTWKAQQASLEGSAELANLDLDQFLISSTEIKHVPVSGSVRLVSEGSKMEEMAINLTGYIDLQASDPQPDSTPQTRRKLVMKATRLADGMEAEISSLQWADSDLTGRVRYHETSPPSVEIEIHSGTLSLLPWENAYLKTDKKDGKNTDATSVDSVARASASFVGDVLLTPLRLLGDDDEAKPGDKLFSKDPLPLDSLKDLEMTVSAQLDSLQSTAVIAKKLSLTGDVHNGLLNVKAGSDELSGGSGELTLVFDANALPPTLQLSSTFDNVHGLTAQATYPRSGYVSLDSHGQSEAELAASTNGLVYIELGKGPFDYANSTLLTANLASSVFQTLIPGIDKKQSMLQCGISVAVFKDGMGVTPYGFAARTNQANLLGRIHVDLGKETMQMSLDSRGRQGVGISVGSIFSNTIQIKGPLTNPGIVPDTTSLVWRGWAAFMTGGLSVLGESLIKRVLASENPCTSIRALITKELCPTNPTAAASPMVCPKTS